MLQYIMATQSEVTWKKSEDASSEKYLSSLKDLSILDEVRHIFYQTTGLVLSFLYTDEGMYDFYPQYEKNHYCELIQSTPEGLSRCLKSDNDALKKANVTGEYCVYTCHAGLANVVIPLKFKGRELGAIFTGQIFSEELTSRQLDEIVSSLEPLKLNKKTLLQEIRQVKVFHEDKLLMAIKLINFMAHYILAVKEELFLRNEVHKKEQKILTYENEQMRLKNDLQQLSILVLKDKVVTTTDSNSMLEANIQKSTIVKRAQEFIRKNFNLQLTLSDVANAVYLSPNYFSTIFKEISGENFSTYLNSIRIEKAKRLLVETAIPIKQIVPMTGFKDYNYFNRVFKNMVKTPPATFRQIHVTRISTLMTQLPVQPSTDDTFKS